MNNIEKFFSKLNKSLRLHLIAVIQDVLAGKIDAAKIKPLKGHSGLFRVRVGDIRIVFAKKEDGLILFSIGFRKDIYKQL